MATKKAPAKKGESLVKELSPFRTWAEQPDNAAITELCQWIIEGEHLAGFCKNKSFAYVTVLDWIQKDKGEGSRSEMYARAREDRGDVLADQIIAIADEECTMVKRSKHQVGDDDDTEVEVVFDPTAVARNKLRVDARKWAASKLKPRVYGDKLALGGADDLPPIQSLTQEQLTLKIAEKVKALGLNAAKPD